MGDESFFGDIAIIFQKGDGLGDPRVWLSMCSFPENIIASISTFPNKAISETSAQIGDG